VVLANGKTKKNDRPTAKEREKKNKQNKTAIYPSILSWNAEGLGITQQRGQDRVKSYKKTHPIRIFL
jgi:hypothetical protein